ncbi:unnamed protein product [Blepharisma stoltei]|uniref:Uncharacterized protein n=1 Tax=Blepharisma stoltei TaxID=1481888 RepID=A0AAU9JM51_9CILI|nr:unnamed protein product [Blepharisma stoltei]
MNRISCSVCGDERCQQNNFFIESVYVLEDNIFSQLTNDLQLSLCENHSECYLSYPPSLKHTFKYNRQQLRDACKFMGVKIHDAYKITDQIFSLISTHIKSKTRIREGEIYQIIPALTLSNSAFERFAKEALSSQEYIGEQHIIDFRIACEVVSKRRPVIVLLGGASGTGKSTLSSLLASRLGISSMLSTDSIRHILRNVLNRDQDPILFCSTYEAGSLIKTEGLTPKQACIQGYIEQSDKVIDYLDNVIEDYHHRGESIVIEGVHLHVGAIKKLMKKYNSCIPFIIMIKNSKKHKERFAVRSKCMTLDPKLNKYVASYPNIREIQKRFILKADECLIPKVDTSNLDRSLGLCHATIVRCLRQVYNGTSIYDTERKQTVLVHEEFNFVARNIWSSKLAHEMIKTKVNKGELFKRFFRDGESSLAVFENDNEKKENKSEETGSEGPEIGSIVSGSEVFDFTHNRQLPEIKEMENGDSVCGIDESVEDIERESSHGGDSASYSSGNSNNHSIHEEEEEEDTDIPPAVPIAVHNSPKNHYRKVSF